LLIRFSLPLQSGNGRVLADAFEGHSESILSASSFIFDRLTKAEAMDVAQRAIDGYQLADGDHGAAESLRASDAPAARQAACIPSR
jgi:hypothetical protein